MIMSVLSSLQLITGIPLFHEVSPQSLARLMSASRLDVFEPEAVIFWQGDPGERVWILGSGRVKILHQQESGREMVVELIEPGEPFGGAVLFMPYQPAMAKAMELSETLSFPSAVYRGLLLEQPEISLQLVRMLGLRLHSLMALHLLSGERVERRLAHILLKLAARSGRPDGEGRLITLPLSRQDLADMAGTTLETTIRMMSRFNREGLLKTLRGGYIVLLDEKRLHELAQDSDFSPNSDGAPPH